MVISPHLKLRKYFKKNIVEIDENIKWEYTDSAYARLFLGQGGFMNLFLPSWSDERWKFDALSFKLLCLLIQQSISFCQLPAARSKLMKVFYLWTFLIREEARASLWEHRSAFYLSLLIEFTQTDWFHQICFYSPENTYGVWSLVFWQQIGVNKNHVW